MRRPAAFFTIALALGAIILAPLAGARADGREEGPFEIEKCQTISKPGSYKLVRNLSGPFDAQGNCLVITANFVTINLAGFSISGPGTFVGTGILAAPPLGSLLGIAVRNGSVSGFSDQVTLEAADGSIVEGLRVVGPGFHGISARGIVRGNTVTNIANGVGIFAQGTVTGNTADGNNDGIDIAFFPLSASTVIGNTATNNTSFGIFVQCPANVTDNTAVNNAEGRNLALFGDGCNNTNNVAP